MYRNRRRRPGPIGKGRSDDGVLDIDISSVKTRWYRRYEFFCGRRDSHQTEEWVNRKLYGPSLAGTNVADELVSD